MPITDYLERNAREYGNDVALVEINPDVQETRRVTWREYELIESNPTCQYRREITWSVFNEKATGLVVIPDSIREFGSVLRRQKSDKSENTIFEQENFYYICDVENTNIGQELDEYEREAGFVLRVLPIDEAIRANDEYHSENYFDEVMIKRELRVLQIVKEQMKN